MRPPAHSDPRTTAPQNQLISYQLGVTFSGVQNQQIEFETHSLPCLLALLSRFGGANWSAEGHRGWNGCDFSVYGGCTGSPSSPEPMKWSDVTRGSHV